MPDNDFGYFILPLERSTKADDYYKILQAKFESSLASLVNRETPKDAQYERPGRGKSTFTYVTGSWVIDQLNNLFGLNWDWKIEHQGVGQTNIWVQGSLTVRVRKSSGETYECSKSAYGGAEIKTLTGTNTVMDLGNDMKAASTDALKKAASLLGIAADIYGGEDDSQGVNVGFKIEKTTLIALVKRGKDAGMETEEEVKDWAAKIAEVESFELVDPKIIPTKLIPQLVKLKRELDQTGKVKELVK